MRGNINKAYALIDSSSAIVSNLMVEYAEILYRLSYEKDGNINMLPSVDNIIDELRNKLRNIIESMLDKLSYISIADTPSEDKIDRWDKAAFLSSVIYGSTYDKRISSILERLRTEVSLHSKEAVRTGIGAKQASSSFIQYIRYKSKKNTLNDIELNIHGKSSLSRLIYLFDDTLNRGYHDANAFHWVQAGIKRKIIIAVMDRVTCAECASLHYSVFNVEEPVLPVHGFCRCEEYPFMGDFVYIG